jgi:serine/threonine protein kinase
MLLKETLKALKQKRIIRALSPLVPRLPGNSRPPRYRVQIPPDAQDLLVGVTLTDNFYVLSVLGYGGMSVVYKAKRLKKPRVVAVKTLRLQSLSDERTVKRFEREAELLGHLNHPRIVQVFYSGTTKRGQPYFVMDYLTGENLSTIFKKRGALSAARVRDIFSQVCGAVDHAHRCGVVHRDLKPGNIMITNDESGKDLIKVVDFGIARFEQEAQRLTRMGEVWGSPIYMSPEQCMGAQLDTRSDIYSLGVVMYEAITTRVPFLGKNYVETMTLQIMNHPKPFAEMCPGKTFLPALEKVVRKALEKEPDKRYQSMSELRADLDLAVPRGKTFTNLQEAPDTLEFAEARMRQSNDAFEGSIPGRRISKSKSASSRSNMTSVKKPTNGVSGTRYPSAQSTQNRMAAGSNTRPPSNFWPRTARFFLFTAFVVMGITLIALAVQVVKSVAAHHRETDYLNTSNILEEPQSEDLHKAKPDKLETPPPMLPIIPGTPETTDTPMR